MGSNVSSHIEEFHSKEALFGNMVKPVGNPSILLEKGSGRLCLINRGLTLLKSKCHHGQKLKSHSYKKAKLHFDWKTTHNFIT